MASLAVQDASVDCTYKIQFHTVNPPCWPIGAQAWLTVTWTDSAGSHSGYVNSVEFYTRTISGPGDIAISWVWDQSTITGTLECEIPEDGSTVLTVAELEGCDGGDVDPSIDTGCDNPFEVIVHLGTPPDPEWSGAGAGVGWKIFLDGTDLIGYWNTDVPEWYGVSVTEGTHVITLAWANSATLSDPAPGEITTTEFTVTVDADGCSTEGGGGGDGGPDDPADPPGPGDRNPPRRVHRPYIGRSINAGSCYDGRPRGWDVRAYRLMDGAWKRLTLPPKTIRSASFTHRRDGGMSVMTVTLTTPLSKSGALRANDRLSLWVREISGWVEWWRGYVQTTRDASDRPDTTEATAYGAVAMLKAVRVSRQYAMAEQDLSVLFGRLLNDYVDPWYTAMGWPLPSRDIQPIGIPVGETRLLEGALSEVLSGLVQGIPGVTWGVDLDPVTLGERWYLRPRPSLPRYVLAYGKDVSHVEFGKDASDVVNILTIDGGPALYPNLVKNGGFEKPANEGANIILNPSFEDVHQNDQKQARHWTRTSGDPRVKGPQETAKDDTLSPASGEHYMELDNSTGREEIEGDPVTVLGGERYTFRIHMAAELSSYPIQPIIALKLWDASAAALSDLVLSEPGGDVAWTARDQAWLSYEQTFTMPDDARSCAVNIGLPSGERRRRGLGLDDVELTAADAVTQESWVLNTNDTTGGLPSSLIEVDWAERDAAQGAYSVRLKWSTGANADCFAVAETVPISVTKNQELRLSFWAKSGDASANDLDVALWWLDGETWTKVTPTAGDGATVSSARRISLPGGGDWVRYHVDFKTPGNAEQALVSFGAFGSGRIGTARLDGVYLHVGWPSDASGPVLYPFVEGGGVVQYRFTTDDAWFQSDTDAIGRYATAEARASIPQFGPREDQVTAPKVRTPDDAKRFFVNYANHRAVEQLPSPVSVVDRIRNIKADGLVKVVNIPGRSGLTLFPVQASHTFDHAGWRCEVERSDERASLESLLNGISKASTDRYQVVALNG